MDFGQRIIAIQKCIVHLPTASERLRSIWRHLGTCLMNWCKYGLSVLRVWNWRGMLELMWRRKLRWQRLLKPKLRRRKILEWFTGSSKDKEHSGEEDSEEINALWIKLELGEVVEDDFEHGLKWVGGCIDCELFFCHLALCYIRHHQPRFSFLSLWGNFR